MRNKKPSPLLPRLFSIADFGHFWAQCGLCAPVHLGMYAQKRRIARQNKIENSATEKLSSKSSTWKKVKYLLQDIMAFHLLQPCGSTADNMTVNGVSTCKIQSRTIPKDPPWKPWAEMPIFWLNLHLKQKDSGFYKAFYYYKEATIPCWDLVSSLFTWSGHSYYTIGLKFLQLHVEFF